MMRLNRALLVLLLSSQCMSLPHVGSALAGRKSFDEKEYPYCDGVDNPSIPCDETYPNGTYIDGNRPNPYEPCSNIFFMCTNGKSSCFNCQILEDGTRLYYDHPQLACDFRDATDACFGVPESTTTPRNTPTSTATTTPTTTPTSTATTSTTTTPTTTTPTPTPTPTTTRTPTTKPTVPDGYVCPAENGFFPIDEYQCLPNYYVCVNGAPSIGTCPPGSLFDPAQLICVPEDEASCNFQCPTANGFFPVFGHETDQCFNGYITCVSFIAYPQLCPPKSVFDPELRFCVSGSSNNCPDETTTPRTPVTLPPVDPTKPCCPGVGEFPLIGSCTQYVVCANDLEPVITSCRVGQVFNPYLGVCDDPANVPGCNKYSIIDYIQGLKNAGKKSSRAQC